MPEDIAGGMPIAIGYIPCIDMPAGMPNGATPGGGTTAGIGMLDIPPVIDAPGGGTTMPEGGGGGGTTAAGGVGTLGGNTSPAEHGPTLG